MTAPKTTVYVTEPDVIDMPALHAQLPAPGYEIAAGTANFAPDFTSDAEVLLVRSQTHVGADIKRHFPRLKHIIRAGVGLDTIDLDYCKQAGICVYNAPGANAEAVSEYVLAMILYALRRLDKLTPAAVENWDRFAFLGEGVAGRTVGIVGFGNIGKRLKTKLAAFDDMQFLVYDPYLDAEAVAAAGARLVSLDELLRHSSIVSLHLPLTPETQYLIDTPELDKLPEGALLINASRGGIVHEGHLLDALELKNLSYAADVVEHEPHPDPKLLTHERVVITPHIASLTRQSNQAMQSQAVENFLQGRPVML